MSAPATPLSNAEAFHSGSAGEPTRHLVRSVGVVVISCQNAGFVDAACKQEETSGAIAEIVSRVLASMRLLSAAVIATSSTVSTFGVVDGTQS